MQLLPREGSFMGAEDDRPQSLTEPQDERSGDVRRRLLLSFDAFDAAHHRLWLRYAHTQVGGRAAAQQVVESACRHLLAHWEHALRQESLSGYAWTVLKDHVGMWLAAHGQRPRLAATADLPAAARTALLAELNAAPSVLEGQPALRTALTRLPERQYDTVVLRYVLGCTEEEVAGCMGCETAAVRSHLRYAKRRLARELRPAPSERGAEA
jgi:RNA polymerase sigma factor (sigma-70 family)